MPFMTGFWKHCGQDQRFFSSSGEFLRSTVYEAAMGMDPALLRLLLEEPELKSRFFTEVEGVCVSTRWASAG